MDNVSTQEITFHPENYGGYFPGKEKGYDLPTDHTAVDMILSNEDLFAKIFRECLTI